MEIKFQIRQVGYEDINSIYNFICELENEKLDVAEFDRIFESNLNNKDYIYYLAETEDEIIGFISFHTQKLLHHCGIVGEIQEFYITKKYRNKGVGKSLFAIILKYADENSLKSIEVTTNKKRVENISIYENLGFKLSHNKFTISRE
jgi:(aminoalkyl)phosphonate N-acetyltransferase